MVALGGSITAGQGVTVPKDAYISRIYDWISSTFPHKQHKYAAPCFAVLLVLQTLLDPTNRLACGLASRTPRSPPSTMPRCLQCPSGM